MTKQDYIKIACAITEERLWGTTSDKNEVIDDVVTSLADIFADDNPNFNRKQFLFACGMEE